MKLKSLGVMWFVLWHTCYYRFLKWNKVLLTGLKLLRLWVLKSVYGEGKEVINEDLYFSSPANIVLY
ncbi:hypothetical protein L2E82_25542 [Cichorium intybus]|uniref:Uncharacterized protein n=1 Tax=Cichorium intybus TaxID=13427 RepID=A0ACB9E3C3_CICIN|nr:hypothetical protein L2E82_25542 [Cichorium intybus]